MNADKNVCEDDEFAIDTGGNQRFALIFVSKWGYDIMLQ